MGFGGSVSAMITSLKNNKRKRVSAFEKLERFQKENNDTLHFKKSASKKQLEEIRIKTKRENQIVWIKNLVFLVVIFSILFYLINLL
ncbi:hypothetical protein [Tenacibaculum sp. L6]|uniref:hypothetical protein n=1 Tax=Tenacibaculum sp. L6 TaxID=2992764 RepID=UPI00237AACCF|nr:hypothetical protein [Tenacibaculum sp. L6]MDE0534734.1 hypothetical protein [Tenacibaculum sp. L6]